MTGCRGNCVQRFQTENHQIDSEMFVKNDILTYSANKDMHFMFRF